MPNSSLKVIRKLKICGKCENYVSIIIMKILIMTIISFVLILPIPAKSEEMVSSLKKCPTGYSKSSEHWLGMPNFKLYMCSPSLFKNLDNNVSNIVNYFEKSGNRTSKDNCPIGYDSIRSGNLCVDKQCYNACTNAEIKTIENNANSALRMSFYDKKCPDNMQTIYVVFKKNKNNPTYSFCQ